MDSQYKQLSQNATECKNSCSSLQGGNKKIGECFGECEGRVQRYKRFVDNQMGLMQRLLNECSSNADKLPNPLH